MPGAGTTHKKQTSLAFDAVKDANNADGGTKVGVWWRRRGGDTVPGGRGGGESESEREKMDGSTEGLTGLAKLS